MKGYKLLHRDSRTVLIDLVASRLLPEGTRYNFSFFSLSGNHYQSLYCHELRPSRTSCHAGLVLDTFGRTPARAIQIWGKAAR
jgi:hypothetical protein